MLLVLIRKHPLILLDVLGTQPHPALMSAKAVFQKVRILQLKEHIRRRTPVLSLADSVH